MDNLLIAALTVNGLLAVAHRLLRFRKGGPVMDVYGGIGLCVLLIALAAGIAAGVEGLRWVALSYALLFGIIVTPIWILAVVIPARPEAPEYVLVGGYWVTLVAIAVAALLL